MRRRVLSVAFLSLFAASAHGEVVEVLEYTHYDFSVAPGQSLRAALNVATPLHQDGRINHGYTHFHINWHYTYARSSPTSCTIATVTTTVSATITLPSAQDVAVENSPQFVSFLAALTRHEQGHYQIAKDAARTIDREILALPAASSCDALGAAANSLGNSVLETTRNLEAQYDQDTGHGKTQGAWLE